ncbi:hypothetical protein K492DRAFT_193381 [Lichtheimia hyalospora FSU 10163]|nr:hypothetical protein K492DRAFT_193381 [Lichtheimia hyalospora FSU 10163]
MRFFSPTVAAAIAILSVVSAIPAPPPDTDNTGLQERSTPPSDNGQSAPAQLSDTFIEKSSHLASGRRYPGGGGAGGSAAFGGSLPFDFTGGAGAGDSPRAGGGGGAGLGGNFGFTGGAGAGDSPRAGGAGGADEEYSETQ